jgi:hypothetical protein
LELFPHPSSLLELPFPALLERSISQLEGNHDLGTFWNWCSCIRVWKGLLPNGDVRGAKVWRGTPPLVLICALFLNLSWLVTTPMLAIMVLGRELWSSSSSSLSASSFGWRSWWSSSGGAFSLPLLEEAMVLSKLRSTHDRNSSKQNTTRKRYTDLGYSGGLYRQKLYIKGKSQEDNDVYALLFL